MNVIDVAREARVSPHVVRYYSRRGLLKPTKNPGNGYKQFSPRDLSKLRFIRCTQALGFQLSEIEQLLAASNRGRNSCPAVEQLLRKRIHENRTRLRDLVESQIKMESALAQWENMSSGLPNGDAVRRLIESLGG